MKKRLVCLTLAFIMSAAQVVSVSAARDEQEIMEDQAWTYSQLQDASAQLDAAYAQIDNLYYAKSQLENEIASLDANLVNVMVSIQVLEVDIANK